MNWRWDKLRTMKKKGLIPLWRNKIRSTWKQNLGQLLYQQDPDSKKRVRKLDTPPKNQTKTKKQKTKQKQTNKKQILDHKKGKFSSL